MNSGSKKYDFGNKVTIEKQNINSETKYEFRSKV